MAEETDGIEEALEGQLRVLVTAAAQIGERIARAREEAQRRAQETSVREARELASRLAAEQRAARTELAGVYAESESDVVEHVRASAEPEQREVRSGQRPNESRAPYDSAERRGATAGELEAMGIDRKVVASRMRADVSQAKPATAALKTTAGTKVLKGRQARGREAEARRTDLGR